MLKTKKSDIKRRKNVIKLDIGAFTVETLLEKCELWEFIGNYSDKLEKHRMSREQFWRFPKRVFPDKVTCYMITTTDDREVRGDISNVIIAKMGYQKRSNSILHYERSLDQVDLCGECSVGERLYYPKKWLRHNMQR